MVYEWCYAPIIQRTHQSPGLASSDVLAEPVILAIAAENEATGPCGEGTRLERET